MHFPLASLAFPLWLRISHYINLLFLGLLIRSGIQVLAAHPRLYWNDGCKPESAWLRFTRKQIPKDHLWTSMEEEVPVTPVLALPGRDNLGLGRAWHFFSFTFWFLNGVIYVILLFATGEWGRLLPTSWSIFPRAWENVVTYATLHIPPTSDFRPYAPLQQLIYAAVVFLLAPLMILTGAAMSPAIEARFPWYLKLLGGRQAARSLHFLVMVAFVLFTVVHTVLVLIVHVNDNLRHIVFGAGDSSVLLAIAVAVIALLFVLAVYVWSSWFSLRHKRGMQHALGAIVDPAHNFVLQRLASKQHYPPSALSPYFWVNGRPPESEAFKQLVEHQFADWRLEIGGLVTNPLHLSLADLRQLPRQSQITLHNCVQGWTGIAEWTGVPLTELLQLCEPRPEAKYLVFTSYQLGRESYPDAPSEALDRPYYEVLDIKEAKLPQTLLAYEMNGEPLSLEHGAPVRLRAETLLGFKMVKYLRSIELVADYRTIWEGQGGFREDVQFYSMTAQI